jgi:hypothetical protein
MPRKPRPPVSQNAQRIRKPITLTLDPALIARCRDYCKKNAISRSQLVEIALDRLLAAEEMKVG